MKKKMLSLILVAGMSLFALAGCGNTETTDEETTISEENVEENTEDNEEEINYNVTLEATSFDNALLLVTLSDGEGGTYVEETGSYGFVFGPGMTLSQLMKEWDIVSIEAVCEGQEFLGWVAHEQTNMVDENGFEEYTSVKLFDGKLFTTEEVLEMELPEKNISFYTVWNLICGGCEERKVCEVFYIDDDIYYVCDDCYEEFAHGMGLE